jgi:pilus assembly protein Flp/PilA
MLATVHANKPERELGAFQMVRRERVLSNRCKESPEMRKFLSKYAADQNGATAIEYGLIAAGIAVAIISIVNGLGDHLATTFSNVDAQMK